MKSFPLHTTWEEGKTEGGNWNHTLTKGSPGVYNSPELPEENPSI